MITPDELYRKAISLYPKAIDAWINGQCAEYFPKRIPADLSLANTDKGTKERFNQSELIHSVETLRQGSKEFLGVGYSVHWELSANRRHGLNQYPRQIWIETLEDLLGWIRKKREFERLSSSIGYLRRELPVLEPWIIKRWSKLLDLEDSLADLVTVTQYLQKNPRPNCFPRELPLAVPTKIVQNNIPILREWLDLALPPESIDVGTASDNFYDRYGFKSFQRHFLLRSLDDELQAELSLPFDELSLPPNALRLLSSAYLRLIVVENKTNLLTLPRIARTIGIHGEGKAILRLTEFEWIRRCSLYYWGDLDVEGFEILALLKRHAPRTVSLMMDMATVGRFKTLATPGNNSSTDVPPELSDSEAETFRFLRDHNLRIEQEHIRQDYANEMIRRSMGS